MSTKTAWRNRITGAAEVDPNQLLAHPQNWRIHPKHQQDALAGVLAEVGWVQQVIVNERTSTVIDGHMRVTLALRNDEPTMPVSYVDLDEEEEALILATLDPIGAMAYADQVQLDRLLGDIRTGQQHVQQMLDEMRSRAPQAGGDQAQGDGRGALAHNHFAPSEISPIEFEEGSYAAQSLDEQWDAYKNSSVRQIVLIMSPDDYNVAIDQLDYLNDRYGSESNSETVLRLIAGAAEREGWEA